MKSLVEKTLTAFEKRDFISAEVSCLAYLDECVKAFLENLTVNTGTDYFGAVVLLGQIYAEMKKPWKIFPALESAKGCLRFLDDFMQDRKMVSESMKTAGQLYARGGYFPEAVSCFRKALELSPEKDEKEDATYYLYLYSLRSERVVSSEVRKFAETMIGHESEKLLFNEASRDYESLIQTDPVEQEERFLAVRYQVESDVDTELSRQDRDEELPYCIRYWRIKKDVLFQKYGIEWKSPEECNPAITFCDR